MNSALDKVFNQYRRLYLVISSRWPIGTNIFEKEWDVLLLLDTCRVDALKEVAPEYDFLDDKNIELVISVGSTSSEWIASTFIQKYIDEIENTVYVSANGYTQKILQDRELPGGGRRLNWVDWSTVRDNQLLDLDQPWRYAPEPNHGHVRPRAVTDRAIANARRYQPDRLIVHYSQPHEPYTAVADSENRKELYEYEQNPFKFLKNGGDFDVVWNAYINNLRIVLDDVELLLNNIDAETVAISADHGEAFGEYGFYRHPMTAPHPHIKRVPWAETKATDHGDYTPNLDRDDPKKNVSDHLEDLGYI